MSTLPPWGNEDTVTPLAHFDTARALLKPHHHHVITKCGHTAPLERPRDIADQLVPLVSARVERLDS
ncbi:hypothetical protein [Streptomyces sp. SDr-06]|uniref:alpha/beta fold hydrolase n=1 Tax=Streptomyces sp. SDr-06 TaxID=2267702 RepID=UPI0026D1E753|nr:hypothetical protein [Streptomyces sp. SDr-06]